MSPALLPGAPAVPLNQNLILGLLELFFNNTAFAASGAFAGLPAAGTTGSLYMSLHTADPGATGNQSTSEVSYTPYARVAVPTSSGQWTISGTTLSPASNILWPACVSGTATAAYWGVGTSLSGAGELLWSGPITPNISIAAGVVPELTTASTATLS